MSPLAHAPGRPLIVGIAGDVGGGRPSTLAQALVDLLGPGETAFLSHDSYHVGHGGPPLDSRVRVERQAPEAFDQRLLLEHLAALKAGHPVRPPTSFWVGHRRPARDALVVPRPVVVVEGAVLLWDPAVRAALDLKIYLDTPERLWLERRLAHHAPETSRGAAGALVQLMASLRELHRHYVTPTRATADLVLSTTGGVQPIAEIAAAVVLDRLARHRAHRARIAS
jgi:uridine kinase